MLCRFSPSRFDQQGNWLEYSIKEDVAFCLCYHLFKNDIGKHTGGDTFVLRIKKRDLICMLVDAIVPITKPSKVKRFNKAKFIQTIFNKQAKSEYRTHLNTSIDCLRYLLYQGLVHMMSMNIQVIEKFFSNYYNGLLIKMKMWKVLHCKMLQEINK